VSFFDGQYRVLRGGSWATQPAAARTTFRNWDLPERRQVFAGEHRDGAGGMPRLFQLQHLLLPPQSLHNLSMPT
jgi:hypothetical protein